MSSGKSASYMLSAEELARRQRFRASAALRAELMAVNRTLRPRLERFESAELEDECEKLAKMVAGGTRLSAEDDLDALEAWLDRVAGVQGALDGTVAEMERQERIRHIRKMINESMSGVAAQAIRERAEAEGESAGQEQWVREQKRIEESMRVRQVEMAALAERFPSGTSPQQEDHLNALVTALTGVSEAEFPSRLVAVKAEMQAVGREISKCREMISRGKDLLRGLYGLPGPEVLAARKRLERVVAGETPLLDVDVEYVARARAAGLEEDARRYVASQLRDALRNLGINVGPAFTTAVLQRSETYVPARFSGEHAMGVTLVNGKLDMRVVRAAGHSDPNKDFDAQLNFCKDVGKISAAMSNADLSLALVEHKPPGIEDIEGTYKEKLTGVVFESRD